MLNICVSIFDAVTSWLILGIVNMTFVHPLALAAILILLAGAACAVLADVFDRREEGPKPAPRSRLRWPNP